MKILKTNRAPLHRLALPLADKKQQPPGEPRDSCSVPRWVSKPRSAISSANKLLNVAERFELLNNPIPGGAQKAVSLLGAGFVLANTGAELLDGDLGGALDDIGNGAVSLAGGARALGLAGAGVGSVYLAGALLNTRMALKEFRSGEKSDAYLRLGAATGMGLSAVSGLVGGPVGSVAGPLGSAVVGTVGLLNIVRDLVEDDKFYTRPDRFA